jgi:hypothetical protein
MNHVNIIGKLERVVSEVEKEYLEVLIKTTNRKIDDVTEKVVVDETLHPIKFTGRWLRNIKLIKEGGEMAVEGYMINEGGLYKVMANDLVIL